MKKPVFCMLMACAATAMLTSCSSDEPAVTNTSDGLVSFTVSVPSSVSSRAANDGFSARDLVYVVYDADNGYTPLFKEELPLQFNEGSHETTVNIQLVNGKKYTVAFFAKNAAAPYTVSDAGTLTIDYTTGTLSANSDIFDAFYGRSEDFTVGSGNPDKVTLYRPFAQVNVGAADWGAAKKAGLTVTQTSMAFTAEVPYTMSMLDGTVGSERTAVTYTMADIHDTTSGEPSMINVASRDYYWVSMNYVLASTDQSVINTVTFDYNGSPAAIQVNTVPVRRNYRTNIVGNFFTSDVSYEIIIDPEFEKPDLGDQVYSGTSVRPTADADGNYKLSTADEFVGFLEMMAEGETFANTTVSLDTDADLAGYEIEKCGSFYGTFEGNDHIISNYVISKQSAASYSTKYAYGLFGTLGGTYNYGNNYYYTKVSNLTVKNATVGCASGNFVGAFAGYINYYVTLENINVEGCTVTGFGKVGGIAGGTMDIYGLLIMKNCHVKDTHLIGGYNLGGLVGLMQHRDYIVSADCTAETTYQLGYSDSSYMDLDFEGTGDETGLVHQVKGKFYMYGSGYHRYYPAYGVYYTIQTTDYPNHKTDGYTNADYFTQLAASTGDELITTSCYALGYAVDDDPSFYPYDAFQMTHPQ